MSDKSPIELLRSETPGEGDVALIVIDSPPVNALSHAVRAGLLDAIRQAQGDPKVSAIVMACDGRTFIAGADIREFGKPAAEPLLPDVLDVIESGDKPVVAAIHGTALGGGFEVALACHARIMAQDAAVGLPEVKLGIIPGAGGTQRLPRLVGALKALDLVTSGRFVKADEAAALGIADEVAQGDLRSAAMALARRLAGREPRRTSALPVPAFDEAAFDKAAQAVAARARGQISPVRAAEAVRLATRLPFAEGLARERAIFSELRDSPQARALRHAFFAEREVTRVPHLDGVKPRPVSAVGVIGAGTMGAGIAVAFADARFTVTVVETSTAAVGAGWDRISGLWDRQVKSGRITEEEKLDKLGRVTVTDDFAALAGMDLVVEAAFEDMAVKHDIFGRLERNRKARRGAGHEHVVSRYRPDRGGDVAGAGHHRAAFLLAGQRDAARRGGGGRGQRAGRRRDRGRGGQGARQAAGGLRGVRRVRRQPHPLPLQAGRRIRAGGRGVARGRRCRAGRLRLPDGAVRGV